jgi:hypothetical protein
MGRAASEEKLLWEPVKQSCTGKIKEESQALQSLKFQQKNLSLGAQQESSGATGRVTSWKTLIFAYRSVGKHCSTLTIRREIFLNLFLCCSWCL